MNVSNTKAFLIGKSNAKITIKYPCPICGKGARVNSI